MLVRGVYLLLVVPLWRPAELPKVVAGLNCYLGQVVVVQLPEGYFLPFGARLVVDDCGSVGRGFFPLIVSIVRWILGVDFVGC